ncbi:MULTISPECIES: hypothetical protein [unclassified Streptomyces]|nr:hypothetical protein [Streptomyces sp. MBT65]WSW97931.1 hypothetical protein OG714_52745 [Streptomyces sp. NBC_00989]
MPIVMSLDGAMLLGALTVQMLLVLVDHLGPDADSPGHDDVPQA